MWSGRGISCAGQRAAVGNQPRFSRGRGCRAGLGLLPRHRLSGLKHHDNTAPVGLSQESSWSCMSVYLGRSHSGPKQARSALSRARLASTSKLVSWLSLLDIRIRGANHHHLQLLPDPSYSR